MKFVNIAIAGVTLSISACGTADDGRVTDPSPEDRSQIDEQARQVQEALGEASCGTTTADVPWNAPVAGNSVESMNSTYDHTTCRNAFVVDATSVKAGTTFTASPVNLAPATTNPFACLFTFAYVGVWQKQGTGYVKVGETFNLGHAVNMTNIGAFCIATPSVKAPADGDYKLVTSAGTFFVGYGAVRIAAS